MKRTPEVCVSPFLVPVKSQIHLYRVSIASYFLFLFIPLYTSLFIRKLNYVFPLTRLYRKLDNLEQPIVKFFPLMSVHAVLPQ